MEWDPQSGRFCWVVESLVDVDELELGRRAAMQLYRQATEAQWPA